MNNEDNNNNNKNEDFELELLKKKAKIFYDRRQPVHVMLKKRYWKNGIILEISDDFFFIDDFKDGKELVFFIEVYSIEGLQKSPKVI